MKEIELAMRKDGAIRLQDGRWSNGFVDQQELIDKINAGFFKLELRNGCAMVVPVGVSKKQCSCGGHGETLESNEYGISIRHCSNCLK